MGSEVAIGLPAGALPEPIPGHRHNPATHLPRAIGLGLLASAGLLLFYVVTVTLLQDWEHALRQLGDDAPFVAVLVVGFGLQVGLLTYVRALAAHARSAGVAASTGVSGVAMLACCAHYLTDVLPLLGISAATAFLGAYKAPLLWLGVVTNLAGVVYLIRQVRKVTRP